MASNDLAIKIVGDVTKFQSAMIDAAKTAERSLGSIQKSASRVAGALNALNGIGISIGAGAIIKMADDFNVLQTRIQNATKATGDYAAVSRELFRITQQTGASLKDTTDVFQRLSLAGPALGASNKQLIELTATVEKLGIIGGSSTAALNAGLLQFGQAMGSGVVHAEEFNSIIENMPLVADRIAQGLGKSTAELRSMVIAGKVTSQQVFESLKQQSAKVAEEFEKMPKSIGQQIGAMKEAFSAAFGELAKNTGVIETITKGLGLITENAKLASNAILGLAAGAATYNLLTTSIKGTTAAASRLWTALLANPFGAIVGGISLGVAALITFRDEQFKIGQYTVTLSSLMQATWEKFGPLITAVWDLTRNVVMGTLDALWQGTKTVFTAMTHVVLDFVSIMAKVPIVGEPFKVLQEGIVGAQKLAVGFEKSLGDIAKRADEINKKGIGGEVSTTPLGSGKTGPTQEQLKKLEDQAKAKDKFFRALEASNAAFAIELQFGKAAADLAEQEAKFREQVGRVMLPEELAKLKQIVAEKERLKALEAVSNIKQQLGFESQMLKLQTDGKKELIAGETLINSLKEQGIKLSKGQADGIRAEALALEKKKMAADTSQTLKQLAESLQQKNEELALGAQEAKILAAIRDAKEKNKYITEAELAAIRERITLEAQAEKNIATKKTLEEAQEGVRLAALKVQFGDKEAKIFEAIAKAVRENNAISAEDLATLRQRLEKEEQLNKLYEDRKAVADFYKEQQKSNQAAQIGLIQNKELRNVMQAQFDLATKVNRELTAQEAQQAANGAMQKSWIEDQQKALDIVKENRTENEKFADDLREINDLYAKGLLSLNDYDRAYKNISPGFKAWHDTVKEMSGTISKSIGSWLDGSKKLNDVWKDLGKSLLKIATQKLLLDPIERMLTKVGDSFFPIAAPSGGASGGGNLPFKMPGMPSAPGMSAFKMPGFGGASPMTATGVQQANTIYLNANQVYFGAGAGGMGMLNAPMGPPVLPPMTFGPPMGSQADYLKNGKPLEDAFYNAYQKLRASGKDALGGQLQDLEYYTGPNVAPDKAAKMLGVDLNKVMQQTNRSLSPLPGLLGKLVSFGGLFGGASSPLSKIAGLAGAGMNLAGSPLGAQFKDLMKGEYKGASPTEFFKNGIMNAGLTAGLPGFGPGGFMAKMLKMNPLGFGLSGLPGVTAANATAANVTGGAATGSTSGFSLSGIFQSLTGGITKLFQNLFSGDIFSAILSPLKGLLSNGLFSGFKNLFSGLFSGGGLFSGIQNALGGLGGLTKMTGQGGLFSTMLSPLSGLMGGLKSLSPLLNIGQAFSVATQPLGGLMSGLKSLGGLGNIFGSGGLFSTMFAPLKGFAMGGRPSLAGPSIVGENGPEMFWPDSAGTVFNQGQIENLLRGSMTTASRGRNMDLTTSNFQGTPFYQLDGGTAAGALPFDIQRDLEQYQEYKASLNDPIARAAYRGKWGADPDLQRVMKYASIPPESLGDNVKKWGQQAMDAMRDARLAVNPNDIIGNAMLSNHHINNMFASTAQASQYLFPQGNQKGRIVRNAGYIDPQLSAWADQADMISDILNPSGRWGQSFSYGYKSSGMTWGAGAGGAVNTGNGPGQNQWGNGPEFFSRRWGGGDQMFGSKGTVLEGMGLGQNPWSAAGAPTRTPNLGGGKGLGGPNPGKLIPPTTANGTPLGETGSLLDRLQRMFGANGSQKTNYPSQIPDASMTPEEMNRLQNEYLMPNNVKKFVDGSIASTLKSMHESLNAWDPQKGGALSGAASSVGKFLNNVFGPMFGSDGPKMMQTIHGPVGGMLEGGIDLLNAWGGPRRAMGGYVNRNMPVLVGERGPEIMMPTTSGRVLPNHSLSGGNAPVNVSISTNTSKPIQASVVRVNGGRDLAIHLDEIISGVMQRGPQTGQSMRRSPVVQRG